MSDGEEGAESVVVDGIVAPATGGVSVVVAGVDVVDDGGSSVDSGAASEVDAVIGAEDRDARAGEGDEDVDADTEGESGVLEVLVVAAAVFILGLPCVAEELFNSDFSKELDRVDKGVLVPILDDGGVVRAGGIGRVGSTATGLIRPEEDSEPESPKFEGPALF